MTPVVANVVSVVFPVLAGLLAAPVRRGRRPPARATASLVALAVPGGGATIGVLERAAAAPSLLSVPEGRVPWSSPSAGPLSRAAVAERSVIGTLASLLRAAACTGTGALLPGGPAGLPPGR